MIEESIGKLFLAGVLPGLVLALAFMLTAAIICLRDPGLAPPGARTTWKEKIVSLSGLIETAILFAIAIGGYFGVGLARHRPVRSERAALW